MRETDPARPRPLFRTRPTRIVFFGARFVTGSIFENSWTVNVVPLIWFTWGGFCICLALRSSGIVARIGKLLALRAGSMVRRNISAEKGGAFCVESLVLEGYVGIVIRRLRIFRTLRMLGCWRYIVDCQGIRRLWVEVWGLAVRWY